MNEQMAGGDEADLGTCGHESESSLARHDLGHDPLTHVRSLRLHLPPLLQQPAAAVAGLPAGLAHRHR